jgi:hypothetical protein
MGGGLPREWYVQYRRDKADKVEWFTACELAIEAACVLIHDGCDVYGIGVGSLDDAVSKDHITRIYALWAKVKPRARQAIAAGN